MDDNTLTLEKLHITSFNDYINIPKQIQKSLLKEHKNEIATLFINQKFFSIDKYKSLEPELQEEILKNHKEIYFKQCLKYIMGSPWFAINELNQLPLEIQNEFLSKYKGELFNIVFDSFFSQYDSELQERLVYIYKEDIMHLNSKQKLRILTDIKSQYLQDKLLSDNAFVNDIFSQLTLVNNGNLLGYLIQIRNFETFKTLYNNPQIFKNLMEENNSIIKFNYYSFKLASNEIQEYILNDLQGKEAYQTQFNELLKQASPEVKKIFFTTIPNDVESLCQYITLYPDNIEAQEKLLSVIKQGHIYFNNVSILFGLYPDYLDGDFIKEIFQNIPLFQIPSNLMDIIEKDENIKEIMIKVIQEKVNETPREIFKINPQLVQMLNYSDNEISNLLDSISPSEILNNCKEQYIQKYIIGKLGQDQNYFKKASLKDFIMPNYDKEFLNEIKEYLSPEIIISISQTLDDTLLKILTDNPEVAQYVSKPSLLQEIYNKFGINEIIEQVPLNIFFNIDSTKHPKLMSYCLSKICKNDINRNYEFKNFYNKLDDGQKQFLIANTTYYPNLLQYYNLEKNDTLKQLISNEIIKNQDDVFNHYYSFSMVYRLDDELIYKLNDNNLYQVYLLNKNVNTEKEIINRFEKDPYSFVSNNMCEEVFENLLQEDKEQIKEKLNTKLIQAFGSHPELYEQIVQNNTILNFKAVEAYENGFLKNEKNLELFKNLIDNNPYIISTVNFKFLNLDFNINDDGRFLRKISKYPEMQERIVRIKQTNDNNFSLLNDLITTFNSNEDKIFDRKLMIVLNNLENTNYNFDHKLNEKEVDNLIRYILLNSKVFRFSKKSMDIKDIDMLNYSEEIAKKCDKDYQNAQSLLDKKNLLFMKYFDITYEDAEEFIRMYDNDLNGVKVSEAALSYMECIKEIMTFNKEEEFDAFYNGYSPRYSINDLFVIENDYQKAYTKALLNSMYKGNGEKQYIEIDGSKVEVTVPNEDFKMLMHSTNAYSKLPMIDDNFYKSWNMSKNTNNHGICTALVSDKSLGFPPLKSGGGCIFGFSEFSESSITNMAPYDLYSLNSDYELITSRPLIYSSPDSMLDMTRHSHNEFVIERTNLLNNDTVNIQPDYVIITNEMDDEKRKNAVKASKEMNPPDGLPIVYIDIERLVNKNKKTIIEDMSKLLKNSDTMLLSSILNIYESVICTCFNIDRYDFITPDEMNNMIYTYIDECIYKNDIKSLNEIVNILNNEQSKFDLIQDFEQRAKTMHIDYTGIMNKISDYNKTLEESMVVEHGKQR